MLPVSGVYSKVLVGSVALATGASCPKLEASQYSNASTPSDIPKRVEQVRSMVAPAGGRMKERVMLNAEINAIVVVNKA